jgi:hypothetical protein
MSRSSGAIFNLVLGLVGAALGLAACTDSDDLPSTGPGGTGGAMSMVPAGVPAAPTWHQHVAPLLSARCSGCHRPDGIGPFSMTSYDSARPYAAAMAAAAASGRMPPWHAQETDDCKPRFKWKDDQRLSADEKALLQRWSDAGAPAGDAATAAALHPPREAALSNPTKRVSMVAPFTVPPGKNDAFRCFSLPHSFEQDSWINGLQVVPGNAKVVHHVLVYLDKDGEGARKAEAEGGSYACFGGPGFQASLIGAWAPGAQGLDVPASVGIRVPRGSRIIMNVHYHPGTVPQADDTAIDLRYTTTPPALELALGLPGNARSVTSGLMPGPNDPPEGPAFVIPAGVRGHEEKMVITLGDSVAGGAWVVTTGTHMHYVGTGMRVEVDRSHRVGGPPAGEPQRECLIEVPRWDFNWQRGYSYDSPVPNLPTVMKGDELHLRCVYDNSMDNPFVAAALKDQGLNAPRDVKLGEQTLDEMCLAILGVVYQRRP